jgi:hypothetical protein
MSSVNNPVVNVNLIAGRSNVALSQRRVLVVGTVPASKNALFLGANKTRLFQDSKAVSYEQKTKPQLAALFDTGRLFHTFNQVVAGSNKQFPVDILIVKNEVEAADTSTITLTGTAQNAGTITVSVFDAFQFKATVDFKAGDTAAAIQGKIKDAFDSKINKPFVLSTSLGGLTLTWVDGFNTKSTPIHVACDDAGLVVVVAHDETTQVTQPTVDLFDIVGDTRYTSILFADYYFDAVESVLLPFLAGRLNSFNEILDGTGFVTNTGTLSTLIADVATLNGEGVVVSGHRLIDGEFDASIGSADTQCPDMMMGFAVGALDRLLVDGADLTDLLSGLKGIKDYTGGMALASMSYANIPVANSLANLARYYFTHAQQEILKDNNVSTFGVNRAGTTNIIGRMLTLAKVDSAGNVSIIWKPLEHIRTSSVVREYIDLKTRQEYSNTRLTNGGTLIGRSMTNAQDVRVFLNSVYTELANEALLTEGGAALDTFNEKLDITISTATQTIKADMVVEIVTHVGNVIFNLVTTTDYSLQ